MSQKLVVVEDDSSIQEMLQYYFCSVGYEIFCFESGEEYFSREVGEPSLFVIDIMLPGMDGVELLKRLRSSSATAGVPVIMLTAKSSEADRVAGLEAGADDYVVKPFGIMELHARVRAVLRRYDRGRTENAALRCGELTLDIKSREVSVAGRRIDLTFKEFELLKLLISNRGVAMSREEILQSVWEYGYIGETRTVDMHVRALRAKLGDEGYIETVRGVGYKMP